MNELNLKNTCLSRRIGKAEWLVLLLYILCAAVISVFHEPFFDEAQAWQIAKSASVKEILFDIPHYEGHPPLWHLLLSIFAKSGAPYELTLRILSIGFSTAAMAVLLFQSPFPKIIRCVMPFTYFFFYQYAIISRPYCISMLAFMLMAVMYSKRNTHPWRYVLSMVLLCLSTSLGLLFAGGLCMVWTVQIVIELKNSYKLGRFFADTRFWGLFAMLLLAFILYIMLRPAENVYYSSQGTSLIDTLTTGVQYLLILPLESWAGSFMDYFGDARTVAGWVLSMIGGAVCWGVLLSFVLTSCERWTFIVPYVFFTLFFSFFYASVHHIGLSTGFLVFWFWICLEQPGSIHVPEWLRLAWSKIEEPASRRFIGGAIGLMFVLPVVYSVVSSYFDIRYLYGPKYIAEFIKENHLEDTKIMTQWMAFTKLPENGEGVMYPEHFMPAPHPEVEEHYTDICGNAVSSLPYFDKNIYMNFNVTCPDDVYMHYRHTADVDSELARWAEQGLPDFIVGYCLLDEVYSEAELDGVSYVCIYEAKTTHPFKLTASENMERIFIREDLLDEYPQFSALY